MFKNVSSIISATLITVISVVFIASGVAEYYLERRKNYDRLRSELTITTEQLAQGLAMPLWNVNTDLVIKIASSAMRNKEVGAVRITSPDIVQSPFSLIRDPTGTPVLGERVEALDRSLSQERAIYYGERVLGHVEVFFTTRYLRAALQGFVLVLVGKILVINALLVTVLYLILNRKVTRPLKMVEGYALAVSRGDPDPPPIAHHGFLAEFDNLTTVIEQMVNELNSRYHQLEQAQKALVLAEKRYRNIFENALIGIFQSTPDGRFVAANQALADILGYDSPESLIASITDIDSQVYEDPDTRKDFQCQLSSKGEIQGYPIRFKRQDGEIRWGILHSRVIHDATKGILFEGMVEDVTEHKRAEKELEASEEKFRSIVESSPSAMYFYRLETDGRLILAGVNPAGSVLMGSPQQSLVGKASIEEVFPGLVGTPLPELCRKVARGEVGSQIYQAAYQDERISAHHDVHIFRTGISSIVVTIQDITERVRLQEMMVQSEKMASVGGLAAGMAHEINNPLSSILQAAQVCLMQVNPDIAANKDAAKSCDCTMEAVHCYLEKRRVLKFLEGIREAGKRAAGIVSSMLEFSRKSESRRAPADIHEILDKSVELAATDYDLKKKYDFRHITIERHYEPGLPAISCTRTEIEQVILNLLKNAAQAMAGQSQRENVPTISLRTMRIGEAVRVEVSDNGPGMAEAVRRRVFEPFFTTKEAGEGTGLGLSVSYFIITANHGGTISVESETGKGAKFIIDLPVGK